MEKNHFQNVKCSNKKSDSVKNFCYFLQNHVITGLASFEKVKKKHIKNKPLRFMNDNFIKLYN